MKLLMVTRKVDQNDALAGFAYNWVKKIGNNLEKLYVISWQQGDAAGLPLNIRVVFLPDGKLRKIFAFKLAMFKILPKVDGVFCHMNPEYTILAGPVARIFRKKVVSWYTHKQVNWKRRLLEIIATRIITASSESFRRPWFPKKLAVIGHGIDLGLFKPDENKNNHDDFEIISVGRISPTKDYESIIKAVDILNNDKIRLSIIGDVILEVQRQYLDSLKEMVVAMQLERQVKFIGWIANRQMPPYYQKADLFINMSGTGSVDKVVLEAMACGCPVLTSNEAFVSILSSELIVEKDKPEALAEKIKWLMNLPQDQKNKLRKDLRKIVVENHNLDNLAVKIINQFKS